MDSAAFDDLFVSALNQPSKKNLDKLLAALAASGNPIPSELVEQLNLFWESWSGDELDDAQGAFCVGLAALPMTDSPVYRKLLANGVKAILPPYLGRNPIMKALGVRDENVRLADFSRRLSKLRALKNGVVAFLPSSGRWGIVGAVDNINASVSIGALGSHGGAAAVPLEILLKEGVLLNPGPEVIRLLDSSRTPISASQFRTLVARKALVQPDDAEMQAMARSGCAAKLDKAAFERYWADQTPAAGNAATRRSCDGRSLKEIDLLLTGEEKQGTAQKLTQEEAAAFCRFFTNLKPDTAMREAKLLASIVSRLYGRATPELLREMFTPLLNKAPFWPEKPSRVPLETLSVWGELAAKNLESLAAATAVVFPEEYLANCAMRLPLKALNSICPMLSNELLYDTFCEYKLSSSDLLLWIWKNRKKCDEELLRLLNVENVSRALSNDSLPKAWGVALRELRALLLDNADFQRQLIAAAEGDVMMFSAVLQGALFLSSGERQSLMVKLSRVSPELRDYLENGAGQRILKAGIGVTDTTGVPSGIEPNYTSVKSHRRLMKELDDIINIHVPENREALKVARAHGDFRENSEFDAAKERRNFLSRRRSELERELTRIQPVNMRMVRVEDTAVIGSEIEIRYDDGETERYYLLGAWDGDPERRFLAYRTRLGQAVLNRKVGSEIEAGNRKGVLAAVRPLPEEIIAELDE